jgi:putative hydrolase of the HAD superfamily
VILIPKKERTVQAIVFDMDDTLVVEEAVVTEVFLETCRLAEESCGIPADDLHLTVRKTARELWHQAPVRKYCLDIGISSWEGLHGTFEGNPPELGILRTWIPEYRFYAWNNALIQHGVEDEKLAARLADAFIKNRRKRYLLFDDTLPCLDELSKL